MIKYIRYIKKLLPEIIFMPVYWLSFLSSRSANVWVFGEWHGLRYSDNAKYLFEYTQNNHKSIKAVWVTKNRSIVEKVRGKGLTAYHSYSVLGVYYSLRAKLAFVTHDAADVGHYFLGGAVLINLTHGVPLKHLGDDVSYNRFGRLTQIADRFILPLLPLKKGFDYIVCADERSKPRFESAFSAKGKVYSVGYPRWDGLSRTGLDLNSLGLSCNYKKIVLYAPTLRFNNHVEYNPFVLSGFNNFLKFLEKNEVLFIFRPHPVMNIEKIQFKSANVKLLSSREIPDVNDLFLASDLLVTDYSSVMFDYDILNKPIHYFVPDLEVYLNDDVGVYGDFYNDALGPIAMSWSELEENLKKEMSKHVIPKKYPNNYFSNLVYKFVISHILSGSLQ